MTREEQIRNAIDTIIPILPSSNGRTYEQALMATGFEEGAKSADSHPLNVWHDASDIPNDDSLIIYESVYGDILLKRFTNRASAMANVLRWAYIDTILPKTII